MVMTFLGTQLRIPKLNPVATTDALPWTTRPTCCRVNLGLQCLGRRPCQIKAGVEDVNGYRARWAMLASAVSLAVM